MNYINVEKGGFCRRPNRFIAEVQLGDGIAVCHVKNTGRCRELLVPGAEVYLQREDNPKRKTKYSMCKKGKGLSTLIPRLQTVSLGNGCLKAVCFPRIRCFCRKKPLKIPGSIFTLSMERPKVIWR